MKVYVCKDEWWTWFLETEGHELDEFEMEDADYQEYERAIKALFAIRNKLYDKYKEIRECEEDSEL